MHARIIGALVIGAAAAIAATQSDAAITVLGNGTARSCFEFAEFGGNTLDGIAACNAAIEQTPLTLKDLAATYINLGILKARGDDSNGALIDYDKGLSLDSELGEGYVDRGAVMIVLRRYEDALSDINKGITLGANRVQIAYYDRGIVHEALGDIRSAYEDYKKAAEIEPDFTLAQQQLSRFRVVHKSDGT